MTHKTCVNMLLVSLPVNSRLQIVSAKLSYTWIFNCRGSAPLTPKLFKGQL